MTPAADEQRPGLFSVMLQVMLTIVNLALQILILILKAMTCFSVVIIGFFLLLGLLAGCGSQTKN